MFVGEELDLRVGLEASNTLALLGRLAADLGVTFFPQSRIDVLGRKVEVQPIRHHGLRSRTVLVWTRTNPSP